MYDPRGNGVRKTTTNRPVCADEVCPFRLNIYWCFENKCWFLKAGYGNRCHNGHTPEEKENVNVIGTRALPRDEFEFCLDSLRCNNSPSSIQNLIKFRSNVNLTTSHIEYWQKLTRGTQEEHTTAASRLVSLLKEEKNISYVLLYDDPQSNLLKVRKPRKDELTTLDEINGCVGTDDVLNLCCTLHQSTGVEEMIIPQCASSEKQSAATYVQRIRSAMSLSHGQKMLLAAAWCSDAERRYVELFPEVMAADVTEQTNCEKRPLMMLAGLTANKETFTFCRAFIPSQQRWVFDWFFGTAVPFLIPPTALQRNRLMLTDGDEKEYNSFLSSLQEFYPNSSHHLCTWHLLDRGFKRIGVNVLCSEANMEKQGRIFFEAVKLWIKSWFSNLETEKEYLHSYKTLKEWMYSNEVQAALGIKVITLILDFIKDSLEPHRKKWLFAQFLYKRTFDRQSTQIVEVENSCLKRNANGPKPYQSLDRAALSIIMLQDVRLGNKTKKGSNAFSERPTNPLRTGIDDGISATINSYCAEQLVYQSSFSNKYDIYRKSTFVFFVKRTQINDKIPYEEKAKDPRFWVPKYQRTRKVQVLFAKSKTYMHCSCGLFQRYGFPCRHIYSVLKRAPMPCDVIPRYHKSFESFYKRNKDITKAYDEILRNESPGPPIGPSTALETPIAATIPESVMASLRNKPPVLSLHCAFAQYMDQNNLELHSEQRNETTNIPTEMPRLQQEACLSQEASSFNNNHAEDNSCDTTDDEADGNAFVMDCNENADAESIQNEGSSEAKTGKRKKDGRNFHNRYSSYINELGKMSEWGPKYSTKFGKMIMDAYEWGIKERLAELKQKKKHSNVHQNDDDQMSSLMISSHLEGRGPRKAKILKPIGSPSK